MTCKFLDSGRIERRILKTFLELVLFICIFYPLASCESVPSVSERSDIERTWSEAVVALPPNDNTGPIIARMHDDIIQEEIRKYSLGSQFPVVIYLHGCTGIGNYSFFKQMALAGFVVIAPDSFARKFRPLQCDPKTKTGGYNLYIYDFRQTEIAFALHQTSLLQWVDQRNLFLVGSSEGGVATALYRGHEFRAHVITQWTCNGAPKVEGIAVPMGIPVLSIVKSRDPWYGTQRTIGQQGHCGQFMVGRPHSKSIILRSNVEHDVFDLPENAELIIRFLKEFKNG